MFTQINRQSILLNEAQLDQSLLEFLREELRLTGTKNGCGEGFCGTCTILIDGKPKKACILKVRDIVDKSVLTIEGMTREDGALHPLQTAFIQAGAIQCGYCIPGMVLTAHAFLSEHPQPTRPEIRKAISANLCRCTGYQQIVDAIEAASPFYQTNDLIK